MTSNELELLADLVAARLAVLMRAPSVRLVDARTAAAALGVSRGWIYDHAEELGAVRVGGGSKPRLRFNLEAATSAIARSPSEGSQRQIASADGRSERRQRQHSDRLPNRLPKPGSVLQIRGRQ